MLTVVGLQFNVVFIMIKRWSFLLLGLKVFARASFLHFPPSARPYDFRMRTLSPSLTVKHTHTFSACCHLPRRRFLLPTSVLVSRVNRLLTDKLQATQSEKQKLGSGRLEGNGGRKGGQKGGRRRRQRRRGRLEAAACAGGHLRPTRRQLRPSRSAAAPE